MVFGKPLIEQPVIRNKLAQITMLVEAVEVGPHNLGWRMPIPGSRNPPESTRIGPSTESVRIWKSNPSAQRTDWPHLEGGARRTHFAQLRGASLAMYQK
jgi:hypothetical protein